MQVIYMIELDDINNKGLGLKLSSIMVKMWIRPFKMIKC